MTAAPETEVTETAQPPRAELFAADAYDLPIPKVDGHKADRIMLALGGSIELDRTDQDDLDLIESLKLGRDVELTLTCAVAGKGMAHKASDETEESTYRVSLRAHTVMR